MLKSKVSKMVGKPVKTKSSLPLKVHSNPTTVSEINAVLKPLKNLSPADFEVIRKVGHGGFGAVFLIKHKASGAQCVWKTINTTTMDEEELETIKSEDKLLKELNHPHIVSCFNSFHHGDYFYMLMEYCDGGDLHGHIKNLKDKNILLEEKEVTNIMAQVSDALYYCHRRKILHRDIKPENVLKAGNLWKLGDFGLARSIGTNSIAHTGAGTTLY